jgi:hypothetical protein
MRSGFRRCASRTVPAFLWHWFKSVHAPVIRECRRAGATFSSTVIRPPYPRLGRNCVPLARDATTPGDWPLAGIANRILRRVDRSHVCLYRRHELVVRIRAAGFDELSVGRLWDDGYAIVKARRLGRGSRVDPALKDGDLLV